eukprot:1160930-Pelagomonas_calceolata.AAC.3
MASSTWLQNSKLKSFWEFPVNDMPKWWVFALDVVSLCTQRKKGKENNTTKGEQHHTEWAPMSLRLHEILVDNFLGKKQVRWLAASILAEAKASALFCQRLFRLAACSLERKFLMTPLCLHSSSLSFRI